MREVISQMRKAIRLMREAINLMRAAIRLMSEALSLMREAIRLMREAISLMREAIREPSGGPSVVVIKEQSIAIHSNQEQSPHLESPLAVLNPHSLGWVQRGSLERFHQGAAGELVESAHAFIQRQDCPSERVCPRAYGSSVRGNLMREAIGAH